MKAKKLLVCDNISETDWERAIGEDLLRCHFLYDGGLGARLYLASCANPDLNESQLKAFKGECRINFIKGLGHMRDCLMRDLSYIDAVME